MIHVDYMSGMSQILYGISKKTRRVSNLVQSHES